MKDSNYDSYCGIYCGACDIMMAGRTGKKFRLASFWSSKNIKRYQKSLGVEYDSAKPVSYRCGGCKSDNLFVNCASCNIRKCAVAEKVDHCIDCGSYPCDLISALDKAAPLLPHVRMNCANLMTIREKGSDVWISEQEERWRCPDCKTVFSWYSKECGNCGKNLKEFTYRFSFFQALILKIGIILSSRK